MAEIISHCANCGTSLFCGAVNGNAECWCMELPRVMPIDENASCFCKNCLEKEIENKYANREIEHE